MKQILPFLLLAGAAWGGITSDNSTQGTSTSTTSGSTLTLNLTVAPIATMIVVGVGSGCGGTHSASVVANGTTAFTFQQLGWTSGSAQSELWYLVNPPTGSVSITVTLGAASAFPWGFGAMSLIGAVKSSPIDASTGKSAGQGTSISDSVITTAANDWIVDVVFTEGPGTVSGIGPGGTQTQVWSATSTAYIVYGSYEANVATGANSASWNFPNSTSIKIAHAMIAIKAAAVSAPKTGGYTVIM